MILRIWRTRFDPSRLGELQDFAESISMPMFDSLPGCVGQIHANDGSTWITQTLWESTEAISEAESSDRYRGTVAAILDLGVIVGEPTTEVFTVTSNRQTTSG